MDVEAPQAVPPIPSGTEHPGPDWIVAIGASAGGLEAMRPLLRGLRATGRVAYLIAQHRSATAPEALTEILARECQLPVALIAGGEKPGPDRVYVAPPGHHLEVRDGRLTLGEPTAEGGVVPSIDTLFASLAQGYRDRAVGVLLSGTGHDGTRGAQAIRGAGGRVLVQLPASAGQDAMVESALAAGIVDEALCPEDLAARLNALGEGPRPPRGPAVGGIDDGTLREVLGLVHDATDTDFGHYREPTLRRQTLRRMAALGLTDMQDYLRLLRSDPQEAQSLRQAFMISVSAFFRDSEVFAALGKALDELIAGRQPEEPIRVWVPGCATGEEAYSIAALIAERLDPDGGKGLVGGEAQIFATDLDAEAIRIARAGVYPRAALDSMDPHLRERFFTAGRDTVRVVKALRELCVFAEHDLLRHPSFTHMDLVSCRNVLIYFDPQVQQEVLARFHYALAPGGLLLLGKSECSESVQRLFEPLDGASRIYRRRDLPTPMPNQTRWETTAPPPSRSWPPDQPARDAERAMRDLLLEQICSGQRPGRRPTQALTLPRPRGAVSDPAQGAGGLLPAGTLRSGAAQRGAQRRAPGPPPGPDRGPRARHPGGDRRRDGPGPGRGPPGGTRRLPRARRPWS